MLNPTESNLTRKLEFSQKRVSKALNLICFLLLMLSNVVFDVFFSNYTFDALLHGQSIQSVKIERQFSTIIMTNKKF